MAVHQSFKLVGPNLYRAETGTYYVLVKRGGKQFRRSLKTNDSALAKRRLREFMDKTTRLHGTGEEKSILFEELAKRWLDSVKPELKASSHARLQRAVKAITPSLKGVPARSIGLKHLEVWKTKRGAKLTPRTWNEEIATMRRIFSYAKDDMRILIDNPADNLKRRKQGNTKIVIPTKDQFSALINELRSGHKSTGEAADFVELLGYSGCRQMEGNSIKWEDVNFDLGTVRITGGETGTKNHDFRFVPMFPPLRRLLTDIRSRKPDAKPEMPLFAIKAAILQIKRACTRLGLPSFGHHSMRHFFCSNAIEFGCDFKVIAEWLGHKDGGVLAAKTYGHLRNEHSDAMAKRMTFDVERSPSR